MSSEWTKNRDGRVNGKENLLERLIVSAHIERIIIYDGLSTLVRSLALIRNGYNLAGEIINGMKGIPLGGRNNNGFALSEWPAKWKTELNRLNLWWHGL